MTHADAIALLPLLALAGTSIIALLSISIHRSYRLVFGITLLGLACSLALCAITYRVVPHRVTALMVIDPYGLYYFGLFIAASLGITLFSYDYWKRHGGFREEYYVLLLLGTLGAMVLAVSTHFASFFLGLELLSSAIYVLSAYDRHSHIGTEASIKYLILAGVSSAFILFGMALVYAALGSMRVADVATAVVNGFTGNLLFTVGLGMILVGLGFKLALFPFFLWAPDVFQGAPAVVTAFIATVSKGAILALLVRYFTPLQIANTPSFLLLFTALAISTMFAGNFLALLQGNLKRLLAYSSVAHFGYLLVAFIAGGSLGIIAITFYLTAYFVTTLGAFGVIAVVSNGQHDVDEVADYRGLAWRRPWLTGMLTACLLSLAGLPLTAGFVGKFILAASGVGARLWALVIILVINSGISVYYYLRVIRELYRQPEVPVKDVATSIKISSIWVGEATLAVLGVLLVGLGVYPSPVLRLIARMITIFL